MDTHRRTLSKVPEVTAYFWIIKVLTTAMGEATSDFFIHRVGVKNTTAIAAVALVAGIALALSLVLQFARTRYIPWTYWLVVVLVGIFGTMAADGVHVALGIPYLVSSAFFTIVLAAIFITWYASERTLSIHSIYTPRREAFYWAVVMAAFTLGTAVGDMTAITLHLGYLASGLVFGVLMALPALGYRWLHLNGVFAFWSAYIVTRPLGASFADWMAVPKGRGGLGLGYGVVSFGLAILIVGFVGYLTISQSDDTSERGPRLVRSSS